MSANCVIPPELDDKELLAYLDDREAHPETAHHLELCSYCREKAAALKRFQRRMTRHLYRITCPSPIELGEYHLRMLPASQMLLISQHLRECPHCALEVSQLEEYLNDLAPQSSLIKSVKVLVARLVNGVDANQNSAGSPLVPMFTELRGGEQEPFIYQADYIQIVIEVQDDVEQPGYKVLLGLVTGLKSNGFIMQASQERQVIARGPIDEYGNFIIDGLVPGIYQLALLGPEIEIHIRAYTV